MKNGTIQIIFGKCNIFNRNQWKMAQFKWKMAQFKLYLADAIFSTKINEKWHNLNEKWHSPESTVPLVPLQDSLVLLDHLVSSIVLRQFFYLYQHCWRVSNNWFDRQFCVDHSELRFNWSPVRKWKLDLWVLGRPKNISLFPPGRFDQRCNFV